MDKFIFIAGIIGLSLFLVTIIILINIIVRIIKRKMGLKRFIYSCLLFLIIFGFSLSFIYLSLFLQTFSRYTHEKKIGTVYAEKKGEIINIYFADEDKDQEYTFTLHGDQWMVEGCILRWDLSLRWLGAGTYYKVTRFRGRWEKSTTKQITYYKVQPQGKLWKFLLKYGESIPFIDTAYGIGAYQYPDKNSYSLYINETGFILRKK